MTPSNPSKEAMDEASAIGFDGIDQIAVAKRIDAFAAQAVLRWREYLITLDLATAAPPYDAAPVRDPASVDGDVERAREIVKPLWKWHSPTGQDELIQGIAAALRSSREERDQAEHNAHYWGGRCSQLREERDAAVLAIEGLRAAVTAAQDERDAARRAALGACEAIAEQYANNPPSGDNNNTLSAFEQGMDHRAGAVDCALCIRDAIRALASAPPAEEPQT